MELKEIINRLEALTVKSQEIVDFMDKSQKKREDNYKKIMAGFDNLKSSISQLVKGEGENEK